MNLRGEKERGRGSMVRDGLSTDDAAAVEALVDADEIEGDANFDAELPEERLVGAANMLR